MAAQENTQALNQRVSDAMRRTARHRSDGLLPSVAEVATNRKAAADLIRELEADGLVLVERDTAPVSPEGDDGEQVRVPRAALRRVIDNLALDSFGGFRAAVDSLSAALAAPSVSPGEGERGTPDCAERGALVVSIDGGTVVRYVGGDEGLRSLIDETGAEYVRSPEFVLPVKFVTREKPGTPDEYPLVHVGWPLCAAPAASGGGDDLDAAIERVKAAGLLVLKAHDYELPAPVVPSGEARCDHPAFVVGEDGVERCAACQQVVYEIRAVGALTAWADREHEGLLVERRPLRHRQVRWRITVVRSSGRSEVERPTLREAAAAMVARLNGEDVPDRIAPADQAETPTRDDRRPGPDERAHMQAEESKGNGCECQAVVLDSGYCSDCGALADQAEEGKR